MLADVADPDDVEAMIERSHEWLGGIDGIAYNVGVPGVAGRTSL